MSLSVWRGREEEEAWIRRVLFLSAAKTEGRKVSHKDAFIISQTFLPLRPQPSRSGRDFSADSTSQITSLRPSSEAHSFLYSIPQWQQPPSKQPTGRTEMTLLPPCNRTGFPTTFRIESDRLTRRSMMGECFRLRFGAGGGIRPSLEEGRWGEEDGMVKWMIRVGLG